MHNVYVRAFMVALIAWRTATIDRSKQVDTLLSSLLAKDSPGAAVVVVDHGKIAFERGYGIRDLRSRRSIDEHTNFRLASLTKQFTATAIMLLVHDGKLHYDDRLTDIFSDFPPYGRDITVRNLLNHTSGLLDYEDLMAPADASKPIEAQQIKDAAVLQLMKQQTRTKFPPETKWEYSNSGYVVLGLVVEKVSGKTFGEFLHERIFAPLGMATTIAYEPGKNEVRNRAYGYDNPGAGWKENDQSTTSATLGDGGVYTSMDDLVKWDAALRNHRLLTEVEMKPALTPVQAPGVQGPDGEPAEYGFGWFLNSYKGHRRMWHYGETVGFRTAIQRFPDNDLSVIILCNRSDLNAVALSLKVADVYFAH